MNEYQKVINLLGEIFRLKQDLRRLTSYRDELWGPRKAANEREIEKMGERIDTIWKEYNSISSSTRWIAIENLLPDPRFSNYSPFEYFLLWEKQNLER